MKAKYKRWTDSKKKEKILNLNLQNVWTKTEVSALNFLKKIKLYITHTTQDYTLHWL